jgi:hypothetical protein
MIVHHTCRKILIVKTPYDMNGKDELMSVPGAERMMWFWLLAGIILVLNPAGSSEYPFGSKVLPEDSDIGRPLFALPANTAIVYWDIGTSGYDDSDPVYLHMNSAGGTTSANDVRLTFLNNFPAGSKITFQDLDMNKPVKQLPSAISFLNSYGSSAYDLNDPVYIHQYDYYDQDDFANMAAGFRERLPYHGSEISVYGLDYALFTDNYKLFSNDKFVDKNPGKVRQWQGPDIEVASGLKADYYHVLGTWLIKIQPHTMATEGSGQYDESAFAMIVNPLAQFIKTNDIRLSSTNGMINGTKVTDFDIDQNMLVSMPPLASFLGPLADRADLGYFDVNGNGICDYTDDIYLNVPNGVAAGIVTVNNVRLSGPLQ